MGSIGALPRAVLKIGWKMLVSRDNSGFLVTESVNCLFDIHFPIFQGINTLG